MKPRARDRGAAAVETALVLPVLLLVVFALIDFGRMVHAQIEVTEAAREGARMLAVDPEATDVDVAARIGAVLGPDGGAIGESDRCDENVDASITVHHSFRFITPVGLLFGEPVDLRATGVMPCFG